MKEGLLLFSCVLLSHASFSSLQVLGESLYISGKCLDYEGKLVEAQSKTKSLLTENESLLLLMKPRRTRIV